MELLKTGEVKIKDGRHPSQMVLRKIKDGTYATHIKVSPLDADSFFILGHYFFKLEEAEADFIKRDRELEGP